MPFAGPNCGINLTAKSIGIKDHIANLADAKAGVKEVLEGVKDQIKHVIRMVQRGHRIALNIDLDEPVKAIVEKAVAIAENIRFPGEQTFVQLDIQRPVLLVVGHLIAVQGGSARLHAEIDHGPVAGFKLMLAAKHILIAGGAVIRPGIKAAADQTPIAASIVAAAKAKGLDLIYPDKVLELPGKGIHAVLQGNDVLCGSARLLQERGIVFVDPKENGTKVHVAVNGMYQGYLVIGDTVKPGAESAVRQLREQGIETVMLTGDAEDAARAVAGIVGIREVHAGLLPQQKLEQLQAIRKEKGAAMFVGDGINDAPVLAGADVGAAMGSGADAAIEAADVVFMTSDVEAVPQALQIAAETGKIAWQNVIFALAVKLLVMILGLFGHASMWLAVFADSGVAMLCVLNSIRILYKK